MDTGLADGGTGAMLSEHLGHEAHVWLLRPETVRDPERLTGAAAMLSVEEAHAHRRLRFDDARRLYLISHAMLRAVLSRYAAVDPVAWQFSRNAYGRPEIAMPAPDFPLRFNLTHTPGLVACVVTRAIDCGVDAEMIRTRRHMMGVAARMFAAEEVQQLRMLDGDARRHRFFIYWTLREAYGKALGRGLAGLGRDFRFLRDGDARWRMQGGTGGWQFTVRHLFDSHVLAVALRSDDAPQPVIRYLDFSFQPHNQKRRS